MMVQATPASIVAAGVGLQAVFRGGIQREHLAAVHLLQEDRAATRAWRSNARLAATLAGRSPTWSPRFRLS